MAKALHDSNELLSSIEGQVRGVMKEVLNYYKMQFDFYRSRKAGKV